ncbi:hypothetical protein QJS66_15495 [Kocuria rhizophila]|nr:hypothetical protein QJS66_15495 [Kocuria rhizophila]
MDSPGGPRPERRAHRVSCWRSRTPAASPSPSCAGRDLAPHLLPALAQDRRLRRHREAGALAHRARVDVRELRDREPLEQPSTFVHAHGMGNLLATVEPPARLARAPHRGAVARQRVARAAFDTGLDDLDPTSGCGPTSWPAGS